MFFISCDQVIRDIYTMVKVYNRVDFPSEIGEALKLMLDSNLIFVAQNFDNGAANKYEIAENDKNYLHENFDLKELVSFIKTMDDFTC